jgi:REP element-mobilizing transposase RayT
LLERVEKFSREWFVKFEDVLHKASTGPMWMRDERVAERVADNLHRLDGDAYRLDAYCVMSNHVHTVFKPFLSEEELHEAFDEDGHLVFISTYPGLSQIMHSLKGRSARECNLVLSRTGRFWEHESFDHVVRREKLNATVRYVLNNPVQGRFGERLARVALELLPE